MFRYRLHSPDGDDLGEATYAQMIHPDEEIIANGNKRLRVIDALRPPDWRPARRPGARPPRAGTHPYSPGGLGAG